MDPEQTQQLAESIAKLEETVNKLSNGIETLTVLTPKFGGSVRASGLELEKLREYARKSGESLEDYTARLDKATALEIAKAKADEQAKQAADNVRDAMYSLKTGMVQFRDALMSTERTLGKYSGALDSAGDAAIDLGKNFGLAGVAAGVAVKAFTSLASAGLKQADAQLKATDALAKVGATGTLTTRQVLDMGQAAGLTSKNLELFTKPIQSMGPALISLGGNTAQATKEFAEMTAVTKQQRQEFQRLGINQEELIQSQADYIKLQQASGAQITDNMKKDGRLRQASLEYTENLLKLSAITGKSVEETKKDQEIARAGYATLIQTNKMQQEIAAAERNGNFERAASLKAELDARNKLLDSVKAQIDDPELLAGVQQFLATGGATTELSQQLIQLGIPMEKFRRQIERGEDVTAEFMESFNRGVDKNTRELGISAALIGPQMGKIFGISEETLKARAKMGERDEKEIRQRTAAEIEAGKKAGLDGIKDARATMTEAEIVLQKAVDNIVQTLNPLQLGFVGAAAASVALAAAAYKATTALLSTAAGARAAALQDSLGVGNTGTGKLGGLFKGGTSLARFAGAGAGIFSVAGGIATAVQGSKATDEAVASGTMTEAEGAEAKQEAKYTGGGEAIGGVIGGALGMLAGPLGAAIGGTLGSKLGGVVGGWLARRDDDEKKEEAAETQQAVPQAQSPPPTLEDLRDAQRIASETQDQNAALTAFNQRLSNIQTTAAPAAGVAPVTGTTVPAQAPVTASVAAAATPVTQAQKFTFDELTKDEIERSKGILESLGLNSGNVLNAESFNMADIEKRQKLFETLRKTTDAEIGTPSLAQPAIISEKEPIAEEQNKIKGFFERNKGILSGMVMGGLVGGPLGIMAGGLIGRHLDTKLETKSEELKPHVANQDEDISKISEEAFRLASSFRNLSASLDIATRNVVTLDKNFDEINFAMEEMVSDLTGEGDQRSPGEAMASDFKSAFTVAMIDLKRLANRVSFSSGDSSTSDSAQAGGGSGGAGGTSSAEPALASRGSSTGSRPTSTEPGIQSGVSVPDFAQGRPGTEKPIAKVVDAGPGFTTVQTDDGTIQKREGVRNWRNNNPGNLEYGRFAQSKDAVGSDGRFAVFPTLEDGMEAKRDLIFGNRYIDLSLAQAISKYAPPHENDTNMYIRQIMEATGASSHTLLRELSGSQRDSMMSAINRVEGFKPGKIIEGAMGGIASGPKSGYPALLHGREAIVPLASNSLLEKMAKTPETQSIEPAAKLTTTQTVDSPALNRSLQELTALNAEMMSMMQEKFDEMIDKLGTGNDINSKMYKQALV